MHVLQLRAARGWTLEKTARVFLIDLQTLLHWMRRVDEQGEHALIQTIEPVNRYPDFVRHLVRQLKCLFPAMGSQRLANVRARAGLSLSAASVRRMVRETGGPRDPEPEVSAVSRRRVVAKYPGHTLHVDLTTVPTRAGFWVPWLPFSVPQVWPFCPLPLSLGATAGTWLGPRVVSEASRVGAAVGRTDQEEPQLARRRFVGHEGCRAILARALCSRVEAVRVERTQ
jgi:hypothetical protein